MSELTDTDMPHAASQGRAAVERDHMGRPVVTSWSEALKHDLPWMLGMAAVTVFVIGALAGYWGR